MCPTQVSTAVDDEARIRVLIARWAQSVHRGDIDGVLARHAEALSMFNVAPPYEGIRSRAAYRVIWPPLFAWQALGARFDIETLEVTAGTDVAYAHALVLCGTAQELAERPELRLRLTFGLVKEQGEWVIAHEHHSFPHD
ncbi:nuclear transport factor 2 family protein [Streptomyces acidiscabies]|uniref:nuclear transport factor 2 family protein n=1 Tax=Streptomyces acidiscabies TaxID=42234 RepID=UPI0030D4953F